MNDQRKKLDWHSPVAGLALVGALLSPIFYVLSFGPFVWLDVNGYLSKQTVSAIAVIYRPIHWMCDHSTSFDTFIDWYVDLLCS